MKIKVEAPNSLLFMNYFQTSWQTIQHIAKASGRFEDVAGFLVLARHATGQPLAGFAPYTLSGAGVNSVHEKAGMSEASAQGVIERLCALGVIRPAPVEARRVSRFARWEVVQEELDLALPHAFIDPPRAFQASTPLRRLREASITGGYEQRLQNVAPAALRLDALMVMLGIYRHTSMKDFGGLDPGCAYRRWDVPYRVPRGCAVLWESEAESLDFRAWPDFQRACMAHALHDPASPTMNHEEHHRFWNACYNVERMGLVYEAVALFDADPFVEERARLQFSVRINDYHAGAVTKAGDPCLLRMVEEQEQTTNLGRYHPAGVWEDADGEPVPESLWVVLPERVRSGAFVGIWRPRFRASTPDAGAWLDKERMGIERVAQVLLAHQDPWAVPWRKPARPDPSDWTRFAY